MNDKEKLEAVKKIANELNDLAGGWEVADEFYTLLTQLDAILEIDREGVYQAWVRKNTQQVTGSR